MRHVGTQELAKQRGVSSVLITPSHTEHHAIACVVLEMKRSKFGIGRSILSKQKPSPDFSSEGFVNQLPAVISCSKRCRAGSMARHSNCSSAQSQSPCR